MTPLKSRQQKVTALNTLSSSFPPQVNAGIFLAGCPYLWQVSTLAGSAYVVLYSSTFLLQINLAGSL